MKYKAFSILFSILLVITLPLALCSCGSKNNSSNNEEIVLRIANWEEYLDEGDWDDDEEIKLENMGRKYALNILLLEQMKICIIS